MNKKQIIIIFLIIFSFSFLALNYINQLTALFAEGVVPNPGHSWSEMECTEEFCMTTNPSVKFEVNGIIKGTDVCNTSGNCLSALATLTNACGGAATNYVYSASAYSGTFCVMGNPTPASPAFPAAGSSTSWTCPVASGSPISCTATRAGAPVNGVCGPAATTYLYSATAFSGAYCTTGTASPATSTFPPIGSSVSWSCLGVNEGASPSCTATRSNPLPLVNSVHTELSCTQAGGTVVASDVSYNQCMFNSSACPSGWTQYKSYSGYAARRCCGQWCGPPPNTYCCNTTEAPWSNGPIVPQSCTYVGHHYDWGECWDDKPVCSPIKTQIGCY